MELKETRRRELPLIPMSLSVKLSPLTLRSECWINQPEELMLLSEDFLGIEEAFRQAQKSYDEGGIPVGSALMLAGKILSTGHNQRVQRSDPTAHGEMDCIRAAGRRNSYSGMTLITTLSPCMMCAGMIVQFKIPRVVICDAVNFGGNEEFLGQRGIVLEIVDDQRCIALMSRFIKEKPSLWNEDIAE